MDDIIAYFTDVFHLDSHYELPLGVVNALNKLDRVERGELKSRLFTEAKRRGQGGDGLRAIRWLENCFDQIEKNSFRLHDVLFSPGQDIPENIAFHMSAAKKSIELCVYTISDELLSKCLKAVKAKGIRVRLITDNNKMRDHGSQIKELAQAGVEVKIDNSRYHMHNKFGIIDGRIAFTGSYNWSYTAKAYNQENLLITTNYTIVHKFCEEFERLWQQMFWLRVKPVKAKKSVKADEVAKDADVKHDDVVVDGGAKDVRQYPRERKVDDDDDDGAAQVNIKHSSDRKKKERRRHDDKRNGGRRDERR